MKLETLVMKNNLALKNQNTVLQVFNFLKVLLSNNKLFLSVLLNIFYFIIGNNTELFNLVNFIYTRGITVYFETYNSKNIVHFKQDSSFSI